MRQLPELRVLCAGAELSHVAGRVRVHWEAGGGMDLPLDWCTDVVSLRPPDGSGVQIVLTFEPGRTGPGPSKSRVSVRLEVPSQCAQDAHEFANFLGRLRRRETPPPKTATRVPAASPDWVNFPVSEEAAELYDFLLARLNRPTPPVAQ
ncbi:hypothetical protein [Streptacidiphilus sp. MAP5-3]|uniref:hypothetical protein n=1 Tax=unclassified Streptacidiphilus TaxID=2643834 RepID=UPI003510DAA0